MGRKNTPIKSKKYKNIYLVENSDGDTEYLATWTQKGRRYFEKNLTKLGATTEKQASDKLREIQVYINNGKDYFSKDKESDLSKSFSSLVLSEIRNRDASDNYKYIQERTYLKHLDPVIGKKKLEDIDMDTILNIFRKLKKTESADTIIGLKKTINPTLDYAVDEGLLDRNPLQAKKVKKLLAAPKNLGKSPLKHRLTGINNERYIETARKFYQGALIVNKNILNMPRGTMPENELQIAFLFVLMTGRRRSEVLNIQYEDITKDGIVKTNKNTTKTDVWEEYPLPEEVLSRLKPKGKGLILPTLKQNTYSKYMRKFIDNLDLPLHIDNKIDGHDTRNLFLTIMSKETKNPLLCDTALSHSDSKHKMLLTYYEPDLSDYIELFEHYWDLLRGNRELRKK